MNAARALLEMLRAYGVRHVFGFPGETTLPLYLAWHDVPAVRHVLARDERSAVFMADAYSRFSGQPGVCESPGVGATHLLPGVVEAFKASVPMLVFSSDIPLGLEHRNVLTGFDQTAVFRGVTKESLTLTRGNDLPNLIRRAFRLANAGRPGPVHIRLPIDVLQEQVESEDLRPDLSFATCPAQRPLAQGERIDQAAMLLSRSARPVMVCGGGALTSQAWEEVTELAELLGMPVGTTITGKGSIAEIHPLAIGVVGSRGGTSFSNAVLAQADLVFYVGSDTDSAGTSSWSLPPLESHKKIIHLDISEVEVGNSYPTDVSLIGDAKATLRRLIDVLRPQAQADAHTRAAWTASVQEQAQNYAGRVRTWLESDVSFVHPLRLVQELWKRVPEKHVIVADPGVSAIYVSAFYRTRRPGRSTVFNYSMGALGYAIPASIGAHYARPDHCVIALTGDGSFGLCAGELETVSRVGGNIKTFVFDNQGFGWIKAALRFGYEPKYFACDFGAVDYVKVAQGFGLQAYRIDSNQDLGASVEKALRFEGPLLVHVKTASEHELVPPVPEWIKKASELGLPIIY